MNIISFCEFSYIGIFIICTNVFTIYKFCHFPIMKYWFASALKYDHFNFTFFFLREFQPMMSVFDDSSLSSNQDTNQLYSWEEKKTPYNIKV